MESFDRKKHWEKIYVSRKVNELSWYQPSQVTSLDFIKQLSLPSDAKIIDIGGGDSFLADHLLDLGYRNITVLDISEAALERARQRLGARANSIKWINADITDFKPAENYDLWHDRATFHFLTRESEISDYLDTAGNCLNRNGVIVIGTFSENGPEKCSGLEIRQYSEKTMTACMGKFFERIKCMTIDHVTPAGKIQNFIFCCFRKLQTI